jgi:hypothetical protein
MFRLVPIGGCPTRGREISCIGKQGTRHWPGDPEGPIADQLGEERDHPCPADGCETDGAAARLWRLNFGQIKK